MDFFYNIIKAIVSFFEPGALNEFAEFEGFFTLLLNLFK